MLSYLIVGTGRCGTGSVRRLLRDNGISCGHEAFFGVTHREPQLTEALIAERGKTRIDLVAESSWLAVPYMARTPLLGSKTRVIHLYRHPYSVIRSLLDLRFFHPDNEYPEYPNFAFKHANRLSSAHEEIRNALIFYIDWNHMIREALPRFNQIYTHCVELDTAGLCEFLGFPYQSLQVINRKSGDKNQQTDLERIAGHVRELPEFDELACLNEVLSYEL